ncbi:uncharacterized protein LOC119444444 [Dermacentor silvarum]|uniref:uncharacterized protein LOC119444444 n=1 Tax=Dermacentor silvarum TaxID=543639 RepID=UPI001898236C|nr:uncharacterized protein LOC119444444 [Dermacentor silvarum]
MLLVKHRLIQVSPVHARAILGLDVEKAFDRTEYKAILEILSELGLGERVFSIFKAFLRDRQASLTLGELKSKVMNLGNRGTPQGGGPSPMLFNLAMARVARKLERIEGIRFAIYASDLTICGANGNVGQKETRLQETIQTVESTLGKMGINCSAAKSELLVVKVEAGFKDPGTRSPGRNPRLP